MIDIAYNAYKRFSSHVWLNPMYWLNPSSHLRLLPVRVRVRPHPLRERRRPRPGDHVDRVAAVQLGPDRQLGPEDVRGQGGVGPGGGEVVATGAGIMVFGRIYSIELTWGLVY